MGVALAALLGPGCSPFVCWRKLEMLENDPYEHPVLVTAVISNQEFRLADGRVIRLPGPVRDLESQLEEASCLVDLEPLRTGSDGVVHARAWIRCRSGFGPMCGNPWIGLIVIPLKTDTYELYGLRQLE